MSQLTGAGLMIEAARLLIKVTGLMIEAAGLMIMAAHHDAMRCLSGHSFG